jgi:16S rRNA processing protein RimM
MLEKSDFIPVGKVAKPHGTGGETAIRLFPETESYDMQPSFIFIEIDNGLVPFRVSGFRYKTDDIILIKSPFLSSENKIRALMDCTVYLSPEEIIKAPAGMTNLNAFTGYQAVERKKGLIGKITGIRDITGNPLFIINTPDDEILIPIAEEFIVHINREAKTIELELPDGLLNLNPTDR